MGVVVSKGISEEVALIGALTGETEPAMKRTRGGILQGEAWGQWGDRRPLPKSGQS